MRHPTTSENTRKLRTESRSIHRRILRAGLSVLALIIGSLASVRAADRPATEIDYPLIVVNAASIDRLRENAGTMFESADRADMIDRVDQWMAGSLKETKGIDRSKPFGMMFYMSTSNLFSMTPISYLPVTDLKEALQTLTAESATLIPVEGNQDRNDIQVTNNVRIRTLYRDGYLFIVGPEGDDASLDRHFPDPEAMVARLSSQYDIAGSLMIKTIPPGLKTLILAYFKAAAQGALQQKDGEPESVYRLRRANGEVWIDLAEKIANQGSEIILGTRMDPEFNRALIEFEIAGTRESKFAKMFQKMSGKKTAFGNLLNNPATITTSLSVLFEENHRKLFSKYFEVLQKETIASFKDEEDRVDFQKITDPLFKTLLTTCDVGHLDAITQLNGTAKGEFTAIGGLRYATSRDVPARIEDLLEFLIDGASDNDLIAKFELAFETIDTYPVHRLKLGHFGESARFFGEAPYLYLYPTPNTIWCAIGSDTALETLKESIQTAAQPQDPAQVKNQAPFQVIMRARKWLAASDNVNDEKSFAGRANSSFTADNDAMIVELRPTDSGLRIRTEFQGGFVALMGHSFATGIERGSFAPRNANNRRNRPDPNAPPKDDDDNPAN